MIVLALDTSTDMLACAVVRADAAALPIMYQRSTPPTLHPAA